MLATCLPLWFNPAVSHAGDGDILFTHACKLGCEGIVSNRLWLVLSLWALAALDQGKNPNATAVTLASS